MLTGIYSRLNEKQNRYALHVVNKNRDEWHRRATRCPRFPYLTPQHRWICPHCAKCCRSPGCATCRSNTEAPGHRLLASRPAHFWPCSVHLHVPQGYSALHALTLPLARLPDQHGLITTSEEAYLGLHILGPPTCRTGQHSGKTFYETRQASPDQEQKTQETCSVPNASCPWPDPSIAEREQQKEADSRRTCP